MITLKTLSQATEQEVFDQIAKHLLTQMKKSQEIYSKEYDGPEPNCLYRSPDGLKCAAGCLIGDDEYFPEFEYRTWEHLCKCEHEQFPLIHMELISELQDIHDDFEVIDWKGKLIELTNKFDLNWNFDE